MIPIPDLFQSKSCDSFIGELITIQGMIFDSKKEHKAPLRPKTKSLELSF